MLLRLAVALSIALAYSAGSTATGQRSAGPGAQSAAGTNPARAHIGKGLEDLKDQRYREAAVEFEAALRLDPGLVDARYQLAVCYFAIGRRAEARAELDRVRTETPDDRAVLYYLGRLDLVEGNLDSAIRRLGGLVSHPPFPDTLYYLGSAYVKKGDVSAAEKWLQKASEADPRAFRVPDHLARVYQKMGRGRDAERVYARSAELRQHYDEGAKQATDCSRALETRSLEDARNVCRRLFVEDDPDKLTTLGMLYGRHGDFAEALGPLERAARIDPEAFEIEHNLGLSYFRLRNYQRARDPLAKAVDLCPDFFGSNALLGATLYALKEDEAAYPVLDRAHQLNPEDADTVELLFKTAVTLAQAKSADKQYRESMEFLRKAQELHPADPEVKRRLAQVRAGSVASAHR
jgi:tetratricopeptide (TPR) repeat protein